MLAGVAVLALAHLLRPRDDPFAVGPTILAGIGGAVLGGMVATLLGVEEQDPPGLRTVLFASTGAMVAMALFRTGRRKGKTKP
jgi:uncharacterized membrane protein YeaQ/YmgE (transglycosylase-associated protein family)